MRILAYAYEADLHCEECTLSRFPGGEGIDNEGNEISALYSWDMLGGECCGDCLTVIYPFYCYRCQLFEVESFDEICNDCIEGSA